MQHARRTNSRTLIAAAAVWASLAVAAGTGCIPIYTPAVMQDLTTGEKLRGIEAQRTAQPTYRSQAPVGPERSAACDELRALLLRDPPPLVARAFADRGTTVDGWSLFNPGLYNPVDREREDLRRARDAGVITAAECDELERVLEEQAAKPVLRRSFETASVGVLGEIFHGYGDSWIPEWNEENRAAFAKRWGGWWIDTRCALGPPPGIAKDPPDPRAPYIPDRDRISFRDFDPGDIRLGYFRADLVFLARPREAPR